MKTLRDDAMRIALGGHYYLPSYDLFMAEYGDWRVVEGVLTTKHRGVVVVEDPRDDAGCKGWHTLGKCGDRVKLIIPPEEPWGNTDYRKVARREAARADRYEKALRELVGLADCVENVHGMRVEAMEVVMKGVGGQLRKAFAKARGALNDKAEG